MNLKKGAQEPFRARGDEMAPEVRDGRLVLRASRARRRLLIAESALIGASVGAVLGYYVVKFVTAQDAGRPFAALLCWSVAALFGALLAVHQAKTEARRVGEEAWAFDRRTDAVIKQGRKVAPLSAVRAVRVKGAWRRDTYRDAQKRLRRRRPRFVYYVEIQTELYGRLDVNHWSPGRIRAVVAALEAGLGVPAVWKGSLPGEPPPPVPTELLAGA